MKSRELILKLMVMETNELKNEDSWLEFLNEVVEKVNNIVELVTVMNDLQLIGLELSCDNSKSKDDDEFEDDDCEDEDDDDCKCYTCVDCNCDDCDDCDEDKDEMIEVTTEELRELLESVSTEELQEIIEFRNNNIAKKSKRIRFDLSLNNSSYLTNVCLSLESSDSYITNIHEFIKWLKSDGNDTMHFSNDHINGMIVHPKMINHYEIHYPSKL